MAFQLSIILPIYNVEKYLERCLGTIVNQHEDSVEIILVDDGSVDTSGHIAEEYAKAYENITVYHKPNGGLSDARNYGLKKATGKYVFFLDSDDFIYEGALEQMLLVIAQNEVDVVLWDADTYDENDNKLTFHKDYYSHEGARSGCVCSGKEIILDQLACRNDYVTTVWLGLYHRKFLLNHCLWFEKGLLHEDEFWTQKVLVEAKRVFYLNKRLYGYRIRSNSIMRQANQDHSRNVECFIYIYSSLFAYYDWKVTDEVFLRSLKGNIVKRYLYMIGKYEVYKYANLRKRINRQQLFRFATTKKDKMRALILMMNMRLYCWVFKIYKNRNR